MAAANVRAEAAIITRSGFTADFAIAIPSGRQQACGIFLTNVFLGVSCAWRRRARQSRRPVPLQSKAAGSGAAPLGRRLDQPGQCCADRVVEIGVGEAAVQLQPRNNPLNEEAALLGRYVVGGGPDGPKLRIGEGDHAEMVFGESGALMTGAGEPSEPGAPSDPARPKRGGMVL
jgi:hypothetical protein